MRIAIVEGGIAGLRTARLLQDDYDVMLFERQLSEEDVVQMNTCSRATLGNIGLAGACAHAWLAQVS